MNIWKKKTWAKEKGTKMAEVSENKHNFTNNLHDKIFKI